MALYRTPNIDCYWVGAVPNILEVFVLGGLGDESCGLVRGRLGHRICWVMCCGGKG